MEFIKGQEPVSIIHYTRPGSIFKGPVSNYLATQCQICVLFTLKSSYNLGSSIINAAISQNFRRIFVPTLTQATLHILELDWLAFTSELVDQSVSETLREREVSQLLELCLPPVETFLTPSPLQHLVLSRCFGVLTRNLHKENISHQLIGSDLTANI